MSSIQWPILHMYEGGGSNSQGTGQWNYQMRIGQLFLVRKRVMT